MSLTPSKPPSFLSFTLAFIASSNSLKIPLCFSPSYTSLARGKISSFVDGEQILVLCLLVFCFPRGSPSPLLCSLFLALFPIGKKKYMQGRGRKDNVTERLFINDDTGIRSTRQSFAKRKISVVWYPTSITLNTSVKEGRGEKERERESQHP